MFEKEIINPPNSNGWFTMTLVVDDKIIKAFVNDAEIVEKLSNNQNGKIGIFVGDDSGGDFRYI